MSKNKPDTVYDIWLSLCENIGNIRAGLLLDYFGSSEVIYNTDNDIFKYINGITPHMINDLRNKDISKAEKILDDCEKAGLYALGISDKKYPARLRNIYDPPTVLYVKGKLPDIDSRAVVGIVGTRSCTPYGYRNAQSTGQVLSQRRISVATGLARGIDTAAALGALQGDSPVIGVVGCGADVVYPPSNRALFEKVSQNGAIVSEYLPGTEALPGYFPARNRIISGLSLGVAVIEAPARSGALITAQRALEQNRDVFVLPGNVDARACEGSNKLLREGAIPFMSADDIIDEYSDLFPETKKPIDNNVAVDYIDFDKRSAQLSDTEKVIFRAISRDSLYVDEIIENTGVVANKTLVSLTNLELLGYAQRNNTGKWEIIR